jgi:heat shock protein HslJ
MNLVKIAIASGLLLLGVAFDLGSIATGAAQTNQLAGASDQGRSLTGTEWRLIELNGKSVLHTGFESYFALQENQQLVSGSIGRLVNASADGCNWLMGSYETDGDSLRFHGLTTTALGCVPNRAQSQPPTPLRPGQYGYNNDQVNLFLKALTETSNFKIHGSTLELLGPNGVVLARLDATKPN